MTYRPVMNMFSTEQLFDKGAASRSSSTTTAPYGGESKQSYEMQIEDDSEAVGVLMDMIKMDNVPDIQRLALACLKTRLSLIAQKSEIFQKQGGRLRRLIAPDEKLFRKIGASDIDSIISLASLSPSKKRKRDLYAYHIPVDHDDNDSTDSPNENHIVKMTRREILLSNELLRVGSRVQIVKTGQEGTVVGEKSGGWRVVELVNFEGVTVQGTYRPSDMIPA